MPSNADIPVLPAMPVDLTFPAAHDTDPPCIEASQNDEQKIDFTFPGIAGYTYTFTIYTRTTVTAPLAVSILAVTYSTDASNVVTGSFTVSGRVPAGECRYYVIMIDTSNGSSTGLAGAFQVQLCASCKDKM